MDGVQLPQSYKATMRRQFAFFITKFQEIPGTQINLGKMKG